MVDYPPQPCHCYWKNHIVASVNRTLISSLAVGQAVVAAERAAEMVEYLVHIAVEMEVMVEVGKVDLFLFEKH